ncbi:MAG TPA: redoxin family protein [Candidatus Acidoferrum sp.]|nr:redoxin family protein [Candidatus Acidoferrum sp.]
MNACSKSILLGLLISALFALGCGRTQTAQANAKQADQGSPDAEPIRFVKNPDAAPAFQLNDLDGKPVSLAEAKGKVVLLNFWATWCGPCRAEIPDLVDLQKRYAGKLEIIALATQEDDADQVRRFVLRSGINYRVAMASDDVVREYGGVAALPTSFVIDAQGRVVQKHIGLNDPSLYERELKAMLGMPLGAKVEYFDDNGQVFLKNAERATELPGVDLSKLTVEQKSAALRQMNAKPCDCGCGLTLAQCRINDSACRVSLALAGQVVDQISGRALKSKTKSNATPPKNSSPDESSPPQ